jgi:NAD(P)-dependent dehydrogenase (short-subunit alcohol dehydrogenase family)
MASSIMGKTIVVTGATSGIGLATATMLNCMGAHVIGVSRSAQRCREAEHQLHLANPVGDAVYLVAELTLQSEVRRVAGEIRELLAARGQDSLDGLVNNAGTFTYWLNLTAEGFETQWALNHLAPFLLTLELLPLLEAAPAARVVTVSSESHAHTRLNWADIQLRRHYNGLQAYKQTKMANVLFTSELNRRLGPRSRVRAFAADPGLVKTDIGFKGTPGIVQFVWGRRRAIGIPPEEAARGIVHLLGEVSLQNTPEVYWRHGKPRPADPSAVDAINGQRMWSLSSQMCGLN